jgi:hypothetical protein
MIRNSITLLQFAGYLLVIGLASAFYNAATGEVGFNPHGVSGLYACGGSAVAIGLFGWLTGKGKEWAAWAGLVLSFVLFAYGGYKVFSTMRDVDASAREIMNLRFRDGEPITFEGARISALYKAGTFGALLIFSLGTFLRLGLSLRHGKAAA